MSSLQAASDTQVLADYGRLDADARRPSFELTLTLPDEDRYFGDKIDILELNGFAQSMDFTLTKSKDLDVDLLAFLRLLNLSESRLHFAIPILFSYFF